MRKLVILLSLLALVPFAFAACGDDDDDEAADTATEATTAEETTTTEAGGGNGAGGTVAVEADPGGQLAFVQDSLEAPAGEVTFEFDNQASIDHDFVIEDADGNEVARTDVISGDSTTVTAGLAPGEFTFYCSVDAHREAGMEGPLTVSGSAG